MKNFIVNFKEITDVENFVKIAEDFDFEIILSQGKYSVDGKSLMGIFSLDITKPVDISINSEDTSSSNTFMEKIKKYIA